MTAGIRSRVDGRTAVVALAVVGLIGAVHLGAPGPEPSTATGCLVEAVSDDAVVEPEPARNVILVSIDTLRADRLDTYAAYRDYARNRTTSPNIAAFANESVVFENAVTPAPFTLPAHVSLFTSTYPRTHRIVNTTDVIPEEYTLTAEIFAEHGYATGGFHGTGKVDGEFGFDQGFDVYTEKHPGERDTSLQSGFPGAMEWLEDNRDNRSFVFVHGYDPHGPYKDPPPYENYFADNHTGPMEVAMDDDFPNNHSYRVTQLPNGTPMLRREHGEDVVLTGEDIDDVRDAYDSGVRFTDILFGEFIEGLKRRGLYNESIIVVLGDHGEGLGEQGFTKHPENPMFGHWYIWEEVAHVPLLMHVPGVDPRRIDQPVSLLDVAPTLYDLQDVPVGSTRDRMHGRSLLELLDPAAADAERYAVMESDDGNDVLIRGRDWMLVAKAAGEDKLYRRDGGPAERVDIADHRETYRRLTDRIRCWANRTPRTMGMNGTDGDLSDRTRQRLEDLGYLE